MQLYSRREKYIRSIMTLKPFRHTFLTLLMIAAGTLCLQAQIPGSARQRLIATTADTIRLDTLSLIPGSVFLFYPTGLPFWDSTAVKIDYPASQLIFLKKYREPIPDTLLVTYRVFPILFTRTYRNRDRDVIEKSFEGLYNPYKYDEKSGQAQFFKTEGLKSNGNISRGISFGNNQDAVVSSSFNLQLAGKLSDDVEILASITDNNIPVQPEGNTQQIQDFDKVFIQLTRRRTKLLAGDFELRRPDSYFMNFYKKGQGGVLTTEYHPGKRTDQVMRTGLSGAISKGKYSRNTFNGIEANQGPYKLIGSQNESFIIVLAGTEQVFIDGVLMTRGEQFDYVIDYNTAEIRFTTKRPITKDKRIVVEFQYSDKNYTRTLYFINQEYEDRRWKIKANIFSEQDAKNQPLLQELDDEKKQFLAEIGDSVSQAFYPNIDSVAFNSSEVLYAKIDSAGYTFYRYSTDTAIAHWRLGFSYTGSNKGNYLPEASGANGRVFRWVEPLSGIPQGSYEPVTLLIAPAKKQLITLGTDYKISKRNKIFLEGALSKNDINLYSGKNKADDTGLAIAGGFENNFNLSTDSVKGWKLNTILRIEHANKQFRPIEPYRPAEFVRDWNLSTASASGDENAAGLTLSLSKPQQLISYRFNTFYKSNEFRGYMNSIGAAIVVKKFMLTVNGSYLSTNSKTINTNFLRSGTELSRPIGKITIGGRFEQERNRFYNSTTDSLQANSFSFDMGKIFLASTDTAKIRYRLEGSRRYDYAVRNNDFKRSTEADEASGRIEFAGNPKSRLALSGSYRTLTISDTLITNAKPEESVLVRIEYGATILKGLFVLNAFYEAGSGQELKRIYSFLEVAPGTGVYAYAGDFNNNGVKDLDEFEVSAFPDQANYIKIFLPSNEYIRTRTNQFNEVLTISPAAWFQRKTPFHRFISRFSNITSYRVDNKTLEEDLLKALNPFEADIARDILVTTGDAFRNTFSFNRNNAIVAADLSYINNRSKSILTNGFESRTLNSTGGNIRYNITKVYGITLNGDAGYKSSRSEFFSSRDYRLWFYTIEPKFSFQPKISFRAVAGYKYAVKENVLGETGELSEQHTVGIELKYSNVKQGIITAKVNLIDIGYNASENTPLAYEVLEGLRTGTNYTWGAGIQRTLSNSIQISLNYEGRKPEGTNAIHTGSVQARAFF